MARPMAATARSTSAALITSGGLILSTLSPGPSVESRMPCAFDALLDGGRLGGGRLARARVGTSSTPRKSPRPRTSPISGPLGHQRAQAGRQPAAEHVRAGLQPLVADHVQHREADRGRDRVAAEGVEVLHAVRERARDLRRRDDGAERMAVADRLAHRDDVGHDALRLEAPEVRADAPEPDLHLVGDADRAGVARVGERGLRGSRSASSIWPAQPGSDSTMNAAASRSAQAVSTSSGVGRAVVAERAAVRVGDLAQAHVLGPARCRRAGRTCTCEMSISDAEVAVVRPLQREHVAAAGVGAREAQRQVVGLASPSWSGTRPTADRAASRRAAARR